MLRNGKIEHKKNAFLLFLFLIMFQNFLLYICPYRNVAVLMIEEIDYEKDFSWYSGCFCLPDARYA